MWNGKRLATTEARSALMRRVRRHDTSPELAVRRFLHGRGLRYVLHPDALPGRPDIVLPRRGTVVFVHGCFWHGHNCAHGAVRPKSNAEFWRKKLAGNRARDVAKEEALRALGWKVEIVWECEADDARCLERLARKLLKR